jgi:preprotein translocase subunit SecF
VTSSFIGASWGADVTRQALFGLLAFLLLAAIVMALYFRTWKMSLAAIQALLADLIVTTGVYAAVGWEISPAALIGILTILSYSLYDTVVVFDKIRENTAADGQESRRTFAESVNLAVNQTLVRSINTSVVAALPVAAILFIGAGALGADTLRDISLALLVGIIVGTWSTVFLAAPLYSQLREGEPAIRKHDQKVLKERERASVSKADAEELTTA